VIQAMLGGIAGWGLRDVQGKGGQGSSWVPLAIALAVAKVVAALVAVLVAVAASR
jgi:hypothetical protein